VRKSQDVINPASFILKKMNENSHQALRVGINDSLPKSLAYELLAPVFR
jgi:hypothetical protein